MNKNQIIQLPNATIKEAKPGEILNSITRNYTVRLIGGMVDYKIHTKLEEDKKCIKTKLELRKKAWKRARIIKILNNKPESINNKPESIFRRIFKYLFN